MSQLYPPTIVTPLEAFYDKTALTIPIIHSKIVSKVEIGGYCLKIKNASTGTILDTIKSDTTTFDLSEVELKPGQFYKVQIAYCDTTEDQNVGYYSTIAAVKYTRKPTIDYSEKNNAVIVTYTNDDNDEKVYEYRFTISSTDGETIVDTDYQLHLRDGDQLEEITNIDDSGYTDAFYSEMQKYYNAMLDLDNKQSTGQIESEEEYRRQQQEIISFYNNALEKIKSQYNTEATVVGMRLLSFDSLKFPEDLDENTPYKVTYTYRTFNGLTDTIDFILYGIPKASNELFDKGLITLSTKEDRENGAVDVLVTFAPEARSSCSGAYLMKRAKIDNNTSAFNFDKVYPWECLYSFNLDIQLSNPTIYWKDLTVENGQKYVYSIQQYNANGIYSTKIYSNVITPHFDYAFLYDGERQLAIKFNPKMNSFKNDIIESKIEAIGRKYPYIFRNGIIKYKEFPIGGLIAEVMDEDNLFYYIPKDQNNPREKTIANPIYYKDYDEYYREKVFKLEVLEWLTNGKPKLFRSISEGNYLVQLINVSLSPEEKLGRLLHNFSATAYEIADCTYENLKKYNILNYLESTAVGKTITHFNQRFDLASLTLTEGEFKILPDESTYGDIKDVGIYLVGALPGTHLRIKVKNVDDEYEENDYYVGLTGKFIIEPGEIEIQSLSILKDGNSDPELKGTLNLFVSGTTDIDFYLIDNVDRDLHPSVMQLNGRGLDNNILSNIEKEENNIKTTMRYLLKLQIFREYNLDDQSHDYSVRLKFKNSSTYQDIDMTTRDIYELNNLDQISELYLGDGISAVLYYQCVRTHYAREES